MAAAEAPKEPHGIAAQLKALPDGALMKHFFFGLVVLSVVMIGMDFRELVNAEASDPLALPALSPVEMARPERDNHIRPYLPASRPIAPGGGSERLRNRPRDEREAEPMRFRLGTHGAAFAEGTITEETAEALSDFLESERAASVTEIVLHSPGGSVDNATEMAHTIRDAGLNTRILADGYCASSCPLVFAGGVERFADATAWIGVHQAFALDNAFGTLADGMQQAQIVSADVQDLLDGFGVDPLVWTRAMSTPKEKLYLFTPEEMIELKLATEVEGLEEASTGAS
jgi:hypothetical protein